MCKPCPEISKCYCCRSGEWLHPVARSLKRYQRPHWWVRAGIQGKVFTVTKGLILLERAGLLCHQGAHDLSLRSHWLSMVRIHTDLSNTLKVQCDSFILFLTYIQSVIPVIVSLFSCSDFGFYHAENSSVCVEQPDFIGHSLEFCLHGRKEQLQTSG